MPKNNTVTINEAQSLYTRTMLRWIHTADPADVLIDRMSAVLKMVDTIKKDLIWPGKLIKDLEQAAWKAKELFVKSTLNTRDGVKVRLNRELSRVDLDDFLMMTWVHTPEWDGVEYACQAVTIGFHDGVEKNHTYSFTVRKTSKGYEGSCTLDKTDNSLLAMTAYKLQNLNWDYILPHPHEASYPQEK